MLATVPTTGGTPTVLGSGTGTDWTPGVHGDGFGTRSLAVGAGLVFWTNLGSGKVMSLPLTGGDAVTIVSSLTNPHALAVNADNLYFTQETGGVWRVAKHAR